MAPPSSVEGVIDVWLLLLIIGDGVGVNAALSADSVLIMLVPCVLGERGILLVVALVVALVAWLPAVVESLLLCFGSLMLALSSGVEATITPSVTKECSTCAPFNCGESLFRDTSVLVWPRSPGALAVAKLSCN